VLLTAVGRVLFSSKNHAVGKSKAKYATAPILFLRATACRSGVRRSAQHGENPIQIGRKAF